MTGGVSQSGKVPTICGSNSGQHIIYSAISNFPARLSVVVDTQTSTVRLFMLVGNLEHQVFGSVLWVLIIFL